MKKERIENPAFGVDGVLAAPRARLRPPDMLRGERATYSSIQKP
jgi:hypothetical protein